MCSMFPQPCSWFVWAGLSLQPPIKIWPWPWTRYWPEQTHKIPKFPLLFLCSFITQSKNVKVTKLHNHHNIACPQCWGLGTHCNMIYCSVPQKGGRDLLLLLKLYFWWFLVFIGLIHQVKVFNFLRLDSLSLESCRRCQRRKGQQWL